MCSFCLIYGLLFIEVLILSLLFVNILTVL
nr:MAG TPA: IcmJ (DotN) IV secretion system, Coupling.8A [Caudoviricetes sp.]